MLEHNEKPERGSETLSYIDHINEIIFNGLRTSEGIQLRKIKGWETNSEKMNPTIQKWKAQLNVTKDTISLKSDSYKYADEIALDMIQTELK